MENIGHHPCAGELLPEIVVQVLADAALFAFADVKDFFFELHAGLDLPGEFGGALLHAFLEFRVEPADGLLGLLALGDVCDVDDDERTLGSLDRAEADLHGKRAAAFAEPMEQPAAEVFRRTGAT